jgi:hypothetical protein
MARKRFLYWLFSENKLPLYVDSNNNVVEADGSMQKPDGQPAHLEFEPQSWRDVLVKYARNIKYWGVFRDMTVPMKFVGDGYAILKNRFNKFGFEAVLYFGMSKLDPDLVPYQQLPWFLSEVNFVKYKQGKTTVQVEALEGGPSKYLKAFESTTYQIGIDTDAQYVSVKLDGMEIDNTALFAVTNSLSADVNFDIASHLVDVAIVQKEIDDIGGVQSVIRTKVQNLNTDIRATGKYILKATATGVIKVDHAFTLDVEFGPPPALNPAAILRSVVRVIKPDNTSSQQYVMLVKNVSTGITGTHIVNGSGTLNVVAGDELYMYTWLDPAGSTGDAQTRFTYGGAEPYIKLTYTYRHPETITAALTPFRLGEQLVSKMTDGKYKLKSAFLTELSKEYVLTSGDALRKIPKSSIKTSWSDFFQSLSRWCVGVGIEGDYIVVEKLEYFFQANIIADIGEVNDDASVDVAEDILFNTIKNGYKAQEYKEINGKTEFNQGQVWTLPIAKVVKEYNLLSVYRADPFGIEILRINFGQKTTTDTEGDSDVFWLHVKEAFTAFSATTSYGSGIVNLILVKNQLAQLVNFLPGTRIKISGTQSNNGFYTVIVANAVNATDFVIGVNNNNMVNELDAWATIQILNYELNRPAFTSVEGLLHPATSFNIMLRPKLGLLNNAALLHSVCDKLESKSIKLASADKNTDLVTTLNGITIKENEELQIGSLPAKLFLPAYFTVTTQVPFDFMETMNANPYGKIKFKFRNNDFYGYLVDGGIKPGDNDKQQWKLLAAPENDLSKF